MPKNHKQGGSRAQSFDPRYAKKSGYRPGGQRDFGRDERRDGGRDDRRDAPQKAGSRSPNHRGYRPAETDGAAKKSRWTASDRAGRDEARGIRTHSRDARGGRDFGDRPARSFDNDRPRREYGNDRPTRSYDNDRPKRSYDDRPQRSYGNDRSQRSYDDRPRREYGNDRPQRSYGTDRPARSYDNDRQKRSYDDRPRREYGSDRPRREYGNDRPARSYDNDRPKRSYDDRPARSYNDRPARSYDNDRPKRSYDDRPRREYGSDRPQRSYDNDRPRREYSNDRPARSYDSDRPKRDDRAVRPNRSDWNATPKQHDEHVDVVHERLQAEAIAAETVAGQGFAELGLGDNIVRALADLGAASPFPIQAATISPILEGKDVLARGRTGSGKTIAFGAPLVESLLRARAGKPREFGRKPTALILAPTRELALQIDRTVQPIARSVGLFTTQIYGGVPQARQVGALKKGVDIIVGTPGRIEDLINQGKLDLSDIRIVVLDEADHMSELGFLEPMQRILRLVGTGLDTPTQKLLFSATLDREVAALVDEFLVEPSVYEVAGEDQDSGTIDHRVLVIDHRDKAELVERLVDRDGKTLVFTRTRAYAEMLAEQFEDAGINAVALHGDLNQAKRTRNLKRLTDGRVNVLVATDVAARGIHVDDIDLVVQADAPDEYKTYLHRAGRTGRAGRSGTVVTLITRQRRRRMTEMLERAEIEAPFEDARPGDDLIEELAGNLPTDAELTGAAPAE
ncbi:RNA helicase [Microbacterium mangrovi]|uniref:RNA helicase n=1 Tax=Microbacterium mangrovi TaxID=1348253 RepID=A0A0B2A6I6_9MICO|nr:DEAD/DEAH box helicase [Microbacterium mangrovi]KHK97163.1 RNA helicase [Microbacterium mangrovi]